MPRTLISATEEVVSKVSTFGRDLQRLADALHAADSFFSRPAAHNPDATATFRLRLQRAHALACFAWQTAIACVRMTARPLKETQRVHR